MQYFSKLTTVNTWYLANPFNNPLASIIPIHTQLSIRGNNNEI